MNWRRDIIPPTALIVILIIGWYFVAKVSGLSSFILPTPFDVIRAGWETRALLLKRDRHYAIVNRDRVGIGPYYRNRDSRSDGLLTVCASRPVSDSGRVTNYPDTRYLHRY